MRPSVAEGGSAVGGVAERPVEGRRVLDGVAEDANVSEPRAVEPGADRPDDAVDHGRWRHEVGSGAGVADGRGDVGGQRGLQFHPAVEPEDAAVTVVGVLAQADVRDHSEIGERGLDRPRGPLDGLAVVVRGRALGVFVLREAEQQRAGDAHLGGALGLADRLVDGQLEDAGHGRDLVAEPLPCLDEQRQDQVGRVQPGLADEPPDGGGSPEPHRPVGAERNRRSEVDHGVDGVSASAEVENRVTRASRRPGMV